MNNRNQYYDPVKTNLILSNRLKHREALNDILGDISPYWNMNLYDEDEDDEDDEGYDDNNDDDEYDCE
jgi:hypothetical protein